MKKLNANMLLRFGFGFFFLMWGVEKIRRLGLWGSDQILGSFYGSVGAIPLVVLAFAILQVIVGVAFFANVKVKVASIISAVMIVSSIVVTIIPLTKYIVYGGTPVPVFLFVDHYPLLAGVLAIFATSDK